MKTGIHPKYFKMTVTCTTCGNTVRDRFHLQGTARRYLHATAIRSSPANRNSRAADGRIDKFNKRYSIEQK
ncbi:MAG: 50S ribosomal protein L31 [Bacillus subtilis]|nr:50S ribosomal protein L31 [Bacillus subtilis]